MTAFTDLSIETQQLILTEHWIVTDETLLKQLVTVNRVFRATLQPLLFRNVNLRCITEAIDFLQIIQGSAHLSTALRVLQISFDLDPQSFALAGTDDGEDEASIDNKLDTRAPLALLEEFWYLWRTAQPCLEVLKTLTICYDPDDPYFLRRFLKRSQALPGLHCLHLAYLEGYDPPNQTIGATEPDAGPWDSKHWAKALCSPALFHLKFLVISTSVHPVWPPTEPQLVKRLHEWFGPLPLASRLTTVVLLCGYGDDAIRAEDYVAANYDAEVDGREAEDTKPLMGYEEGDCGWPPGVELSFHAPVVFGEIVGVDFGLKTF
ncbi:hypothetical protein C8R46DRAFT_1221981 [Mycena filopes]|nr:hypothetical protein C8R46DRAFT_1221981 [Mycena filopes]